MTATRMLELAPKDIDLPLVAVARRYRRRWRWRWKWQWQLMRNVAVLVLTCDYVRLVVVVVVVVFMLFAVVGIVVMQLVAVLEESLRPALLKGGDDRVDDVAGRGRDDGRDVVVVMTSVVGRVVKIGRGGGEEVRVDATALEDSAAQGEVVQVAHAQEGAAHPGVALDVVEGGGGGGGAEGRGRGVHECDAM